MSRWSDDRHDRERAALRSDLAGIAVDVALLRVQQSLARKDRPDQSRAPAGQTDGGRWISDARPARMRPGPRMPFWRTEHTSFRSAFDPTRTRTGTNGTPSLRRTGHATVFETSGLSQTIRDGDTGAILSRSTLTADGAEPDAFVQPARSSSRLPDVLAQQVARTLEAAGALFTVLAGRNDDGRKAVFAAPASEYLPGDAYDQRAIWVGAIGQAELDELCPRNREVQALADTVAANVRASGHYMDARDFGNKVHARIAKIVNDQQDPNFIAETSYDPIMGTTDKYGAKGSIRIDMLEHSRPSTVCVYDHKTGNAELRATRAIDIIGTVQKNFRGALRYIRIQIRAKP